jgi:hypothetical protein
MGLGRGVAALAGCVPGVAPPFIDDGLGHAGGDQPPRHPLARAQIQRFLHEGTRFGLQTRGQLHRT